jgi:hypothetical protein
VKALDRGVDAITEKPMVIDEKQLEAVLAAEKRNHKNIVVTFNYRYAPKHQKIKRAYPTTSSCRALVPGPCPASRAFSTAERRVGQARQDRGPGHALVSGVPGGERECIRRPPRPAP